MLFVAVVTAAVFGSTQTETTFNFNLPVERGVTVIQHLARYWRTFNVSTAPTVLHTLLLSLLVNVKSTICTACCTNYQHTVASDFHRSRFHSNTYVNCAKLTRPLLHLPLRRYKWYCKL
eukprot:6212650-Pleurochrysis_carterae.AAC.3